jgi:hypothetical protein
MILISHRGNLKGSNKERENTPDYIDEAINGLNFVEVDIRMIKGDFYLGHDEPKYKVSRSWLNTRNHFLILHCKNVEALKELKADFKCFSHDKDDCVLMSNCFWIWTYPGSELTEDSIAVMPEDAFGWNISKCYGICSDFIENYK